MKTILIRIAIMLFLRWLKKTREPNELVVRVNKAATTTELIAAFEDGGTEDDINDIITDIEEETISNVVSGIIRK